jgi:hypothetical protein
MAGAGMMTCTEFAQMLGRAATRAEAEINIPTEIVMASVATEAKAAIGTYEFGWPALAESTLKRKAADTPLIETGDMRASVEWKAELAPGGAEGLVYSNDKIALYQELGTDRGIPPRSFLFKSMWLCGPALAKTFGVFAESLFR